MLLASALAIGIVEQSSMMRFFTAFVTLRLLGTPGARQLTLIVTVGAELLEGLNSLTQVPKACFDLRMSVEVQSRIRPPWLP